MLAIVFLVAITNLCLGFYLGTKVPISMILGRESRGDAPESVGDVGSRGATNASTAASLTQSSTPIACNAAPTLPAASAGPATTAAPWSAPKTWQDFGQQLQTIRDRIRYARSASDKRLAIESATQLKGCTEFWYSELTATLAAREASLHRTDSGSSDAETDSMQLELCLSQLETTLTNIASLEWNGPIEEVLDHLSREAELLDKNRRLASAPA